MFLSSNTNLTSRDKINVILRAFKSAVQRRQNQLLSAVYMTSIMKSNDVKGGRNKRSRMSWNNYLLRRVNKLATYLGSYHHNLGAQSPLIENVFRQRVKDPSSEELKRLD